MLNLSPSPLIEEVVENAGGELHFKTRFLTESVFNGNVRYLLDINSPVTDEEAVEAILVAYRLMVLSTRDRKDPRFIKDYYRQELSYWRTRLLDEEVWLSPTGKLFVLASCSPEELAEVREELELNEDYLEQAWGSSNDREGLAATPLGQTLARLQEKREEA